MRYLRQCMATAILIVAAVMVPSLAAAQRWELPNLPGDEKKAISDFQRRARDYEKAVQSLPADKLKPTNDVKQLEQRRASLREGIQQARANAKQGDLFTAEAAQAFRDILKQTVEGTDGAKIKTSLNHAEPAAPVNLAVNHEYPNQKGQPVQSVPPSLLAHLPPLPKRLEYRIAGKTLALRDRDANLVVDYLPDALP